MKDCIRRLEKAGKPLTEKQLNALQTAKDEGLSDDLAVRKVVLMAHQNVVDIVGRAREEGATVAPFSNPVIGALQFQTKALTKIADRKNEINEQVDTLSDDYARRKILQGWVNLIQLDPSKFPATIIDLTDDKQVMDAMLQLTFSKSQEQLAKYGLEGKTHQELFDNFRKMQAEMPEILEKIKKLQEEKSNLDKQVNAIFSGVGKQTLYQDEVPRLKVMHNIDSNNLVAIDELGGLPVPSMAVTPEGQPYTNFGDISLIGTEDMGDPSNVPIFDADGYTIRFIEPEYKPAPASVRDPIISELVAWEQFKDNSQISYYVEKYMRDDPNPQEVVWRMLNSSAVKAWYLTEVWGEELTPRMEDVRPRFKWSWDDDVVEFFTNEQNIQDFRAPWESPERQAVLAKAGDLVQKAVKRNYMKRGKSAERAEELLKLGAFVNDDGKLTDNRFSLLVNDVQRKGTTQVDEVSTREMLDARLNNNEIMAKVMGAAFGEGAKHIHFKSWVEEKVGTSFGEPRLKLNGKWVEYNLENIVRKMKGNLRGTEQGFAEWGGLNEGLMRALASHRFKRLEEMRARAELKIGDTTEIQRLREDVRNKMTAWLGQMSQFYAEADPSGYIDYFYADDAARRAIVQWATSGEMPTANDLEDALERQGFDVSSNEGVPDWLVDEGMQVAMDWLAVPVPYFEAKPQRAVKLEEFAGAVIGDKTPPEVQAVLRKHRIPFKMYSTRGVDVIQSRIDATNEFVEQLNNQGARTLFQSEIGFTSGLLTAARVMPREKGSPQEMLETLKKQPNVKQEEIDLLGLEEWIEMVHSQEAAKAEEANEPYPEKPFVTRDQIIQFIEQGGVQLEESWYVGVGDPPVTQGNSSWNNADLPESWRDPETGEFPENTYAFEPRILNWTEGVPDYLVILDEDAGNVYVFNEETDEQLDLDAPMNEQTLAHAEEAIDADLLKYVGAPNATPPYVDPKGSTSWTEYTLGHWRGDRVEGSNQREILLHVPTVGGYQYKMEDLQESHHPQLNDPALSPLQRELVEDENERYWFIDARSPLHGRITPEGNQVYRLQTYKLSKQAYGSLEDAKQYLIDNQKVDAPSAANFDSHAFDEKNIIAWIRASDRVGPNGEKILFIEENQSDLHQAGLTQGYRYSDEKQLRSVRALQKIEMKAGKMLEKLERPLLGFDSVTEALRVYRRDMEDPRPEGSEAAKQDPFKSLTKKQHALMKQAVAEWHKNEKVQAGGPIPDMPWKGDAWAELSMKRIIRLAVEQGYDQVAWTTGKQQLGMYGLSDRFSKIEWDPRDQQLVTYDNDGRVADTRYVSLEDLPGIIGAEPTAEIKRQINEKRRRYSVVQFYDPDRVEAGVEDFMSNEMVMELDDPSLGKYERQWLKENGRVFGLMDENGEIIHQSDGSYQMWEYYDGAEEGLDDFAFGDESPNVTNLQMDDDETSGLKRRYDQLLVNVANRVLKKLDKSVKVKRAGIQMKQDYPQDANWGVRINRINNGSIAPGIVAPGEFYVEDFPDYDNLPPPDPVTGRFSTVGDTGRKRISPFFDTWEEADEFSNNIDEGYGYLQHGFEITPAMREIVMEGQTYFQDKHRGSIDFYDQMRAIIRLTQTKDMSTFLHESAHLYLELMGDLVEMTHADPKLIDDYAKILKHLGVNNRWEIETRHHELFARSWEAYVREGKSPTAELQPVFSAYSGWLRQIYSVITKLLRPDEPQLTDELRGVFNRMVASERAITESEQMLEYVELFATAEEMGVSQEVFDVYKRDMQVEHDAEVDKLTRKALKSETWAKQQWWNDERKKVAEEVRKEAEEMPVYRALAMLQRGKLPDGSDPPHSPIKLDKEDLISRYGKDFMKTLPGRGKYSVYAVKGGTDADVVASLYGFADADALIKALMDAPKMEQWIKDEADRRMKELHPDPLNDPEIAEKVTRQVHTTKRGQILAKELRALRKKMAEDKAIVKATKDEAKRTDKEAMEANKAQLPKRESLAQIKAAAAEVIAKKRIRDINPRRYMMAERKAGRLAWQALERKDYAKAYEYKLSQIMNFEAYRAAQKAKDQSLRDRKYLASFNKKSKKSRMAKAGYLERIEAILENVDLRQLSLTRIDRERLEGELMAAIESGDIVTTPEVVALLRESGATNWKDLTFEEFGGIRDVVKQLEHLARREYEIIVNGEKVIIQEKIDEVVASVIENNELVPLRRTEKKGGERFKMSVRDAVGHWLRSSSIARVLDKAGFGAVTRNIIVPIRKAVTEKLLPWQHKAAEDVAKIYHKHYTNDELVALKKRLPVDVLGETWDKSDILVLALYWGSQSSREAVLNGVLEDAFGNRYNAYTQQDVEALLAMLDARDWAFVQDIWDYQGSYWSQLEETEKRRRGIAPKKVEALPFTIRTADGEEVSLRGGYHHLQYMPDTGGGKADTSEKEQRTAEMQFQDAYKNMQKGSYISANTRAGATYNRTKGHGRVVKLSLSTIDQNLREILRDMALGDEVNMVHRILESRELRRATKNTDTMELLQELKLWLSDAAVGELPAQSSIERGLSWIRVGFTKSKLAFNVFVTLLQFTGVFQTMATIGTAQYGRGFAKFMSNPQANWKLVLEQSKFMQARYGVMQAFDKDIADTRAFLQAYFGGLPTKGAASWDWISAKYFLPIAKCQQLVDTTTWMAAYDKAINDPVIGSHEDAVNYADAQVERAQTSGLFTDRSGLERGTLGTRTRQGQFVRLWTVLISYMLAKGNIAYEKYQITDFKNPNQVIGFASDMVLLFLMEGMASALLYGDWPDEDENFVAWAGAATIESIASGIPIVREYSGAKYGSGNTPIGAMTVDVWKSLEQVGQGELDEPMVKSLVKAAGTMFHLPASQTNRFVEAAFKEGDTELHEWMLGVDEED
jgi:hypothetical protein